MPYCVRGLIVSRAAGGGIGLSPADNMVLAGGTWPAQARQAAVVFAAAAEQDADESLGQRLLADIRDVAGTFAVSFVAFRELVSSLIKLDDAPWRDLELTARGLSDRLRPYGITPRRDATGAMRGYRLEDFADAFSRYRPGPRQKPSSCQIRLLARNNALTVRGRLTLLTVRANRSVRRLPGNLTF